MPCKCPCCGKSKTNKKNFADKLEENERLKTEKEQRVLKNYAVLREDVYKGMMKRFFSEGNDHRMFVRQYLEGEDVADISLLKKLDDDEPDKSDSFFRNYLLIHPETSRIIDLWEFIMLLAYLVEMILMPYTVFIDINLPKYEEFDCFNYYAELTIDILHVINMYVCFNKALKTDLGWNTKCSFIMFNYIT
jgi:hypothetical protein